MDSDTYWRGYFITAAIIFVITWIYCIAVYGFLMGVGLGWLPSLITAAIAALLWPLYLVAIVIGLLWLGHEFFIKG